MVTWSETAKGSAAQRFRQVWEAAGDECRRLLPGRIIFGPGQTDWQFRLPQTDAERDPDLARRLQSDSGNDAIRDLANAEILRARATRRVDSAAVVLRRNRIGTLQWLAKKHEAKKCTAPDS